MILKYWDFIRSVMTVHELWRKLIIKLADSASELVIRRLPVNQWGRIFERNSLSREVAKMFFSDMFVHRTQFLMKGLLTRKHVTQRFAFPWNLYWVYWGHNTKAMDRFSWNNFGSVVINFGRKEVYFISQNSTSTLANKSN